MLDAISRRSHILTLPEETRGVYCMYLSSWAYLTSLPSFLDIFVVSPLLQPTKQLRDIHLQEPLTQLDFGRPFFHNKRIQAPSFSPVFKSTDQTQKIPFRNEILTLPKPSR